MFALKSCPRCRGDLYKTLDDEITCIQCGHSLPLDATGPAPARLGHPRTPMAGRAKAA
ncbi:MAG TPA: hypothetical protein VND24_04155 [Steroidobacteraceae bacterium]|nr:hypothetical protein [Steroidobacteraceae bacterium]